MITKIYFNKMNRNTIILSTILVALLFTFLTTSDVNAGRIYIWTDANGVEHISNQPPPEGVKPKETMKNRKTSKSPVGIAPGRVNDCIELEKEAQLLSDEDDKLSNERVNLWIKNRRAKKEGLYNMYKREMDRVKRREEEVSMRRRTIWRKQKVFNCP